MARPFNFSAWTKFQDQPVAFPGKIYDRADNDGTSHCPVGGPAPYGRVLIRGPEAHPGTRGPTGQTFSQGGRYFTGVDSCCLPDKNRTALKTPAGTTFAAAGISLPVDAGGLFMPLGVGMWTEHGNCANTPLEQPFGLGDYFYQRENDGQIGIATEGRIWAYCETDMNVGDPLFFRTIVTSTTDGLQLLGGFSNVNTIPANFQAFSMGKVFRPGKAGGAFVLSLNGPQ
jgi:hypothetical protein